ncbi:MAG: hypothetical protein RLZZ238_1423 [Planctomycetota bacterium]|jgi:hypothetical protein
MPSATLIEDLTRAQLTEWIVSCALIVVGTSLLTRARFWVAAVQTNATHPLVPFLAGLYSLLAGLVVVLTHNMWVADARVIVTVLGWIALAVGVILLLAPETYAALLRRIPVTPALIAIRGLIRLALGGVVLGYLLTQG